jgi:hypothetical protein
MASIPRDSVIDPAPVRIRDALRDVGAAEAIARCGWMSAPAEVVDDIRQRRYGDPGPASQRWIARRAELTLAFPRPAIEQVVARWSPSTGRSCCEYEQVPVDQLDRSRAAVAANGPQPVRVRLG